MKPVPISIPESYTHGRTGSILDASFIWIVRSHEFAEGGHEIKENYNRATHHCDAVFLESYPHQAPLARSVELFTL